MKQKLMMAFILETMVTWYSIPLYRVDVQTYSIVSDIWGFPNPQGTIMVENVCSKTKYKPSDKHKWAHRQRITDYFLGKISRDTNRL